LTLFGILSDEDFAVTMYFFPFGNLTFDLAVMRTSFFSMRGAMLLTLREGCDSVRPGLDLGPDCVVRVGLERNPVAGEREVVQFTVGVVAPEG